MLFFPKLYKIVYRLGNDNLFNKKNEVISAFSFSIRFWNQYWIDPLVLLTFNETFDARFQRCSILTWAGENPQDYGAQDEQKRDDMDRSLRRFEQILLPLRDMGFRINSRELQLFPWMWVKLVRDSGGASVSVHWRQKWWWWMWTERFEDGGNGMYVLCIVR